MINRRDFLRTGMRSAALLAGGASLLRLSHINALAQTGSDYRALVCVFLTGGNDANNMVVPMSTTSYAEYAASRGPLALAQSSLLPIVTTSGRPFGLHAQLAGLDTLFQQRRLAIIANVGTLVRPLTRDEYRQQIAPVPRNLFSHIDQQRAWQTAATPNYPTGWGARVTEQLPTGGVFPAVLSTAGEATFGRGASTTHATIIPGLPPGLIGSDGSSQSLSRQQAVEQLLALPSGSVLVGTASETTREGLRHAALLTAALRSGPALATPFPTTALGSQLAEVAKVIAVRQQLGVNRQVFFCALQGFDTHIGQLNTQAALLGQLAQALTAFHTATIELGVSDQVTTFTQSEFGRTLQPTTALGTDHAWGSHHVVLGGAVRGATVYGTFPSLAIGGPDDANQRGVLLPTTSLDQYGATLASWLGVRPQDLPAVFPGITNFESSDLGFLAPPA